MQNQASLQETKQHGAVRFPFNLYPCTIPGDFQQVALHWHESMELVFVKQGMGLVQVGVVTYPAYRGDIFIFAPGTLHALRQAEGQRMEYENIIFEPELLGGAEDLCAEKYLLPLQSGRLSLPVRLTPNDLCYLQAAACLRELEDANRAKRPGYEVPETLLPGKGRFVDEKGDFLGWHEGYPFYTVGQRRGLGIHLNKAVFVKETRVESNEVVLAPLSSLYKQEMWLGEWNLVENSRVLGANEVIVKIRYRKQANRCRVTLTVEGLLRVRLIEPLESIAPGQAAAFYDKDGYLLGGGIIL